MQQSYDTQGRPFASNVGARALSLLNGVKLTAGQFEGLYNLKGGIVQRIVDGKLAPTPEFLDAFDRHGPLRIGDLYDPSVRHWFQVEDDTKDGILIYGAEQTASTDRQTFRGQEGAKVHFYSYRDTAMSKTSLFRPEWISEHYPHDGVNPDTPNEAFNKGHFEHQITYFVGPVNFHWIDAKGQKHVRQMNTGDTNYITPFVPHTFTTREEGKGLILAVTYGGAIATEQYQQEIQDKTLELFLGSLALPAISGQLQTDTLGGVIVNGHAGRKDLGNNVAELIGGIPFQPDPRALEYLIEGNGHPHIRVDVERWGYNIGSTPVAIEWASHSETLKPGDSFFIRPNVGHSLRGTGKLLVMEIKPEGSSPLEELALINKYAGTRGLSRVHTENTQWF